MRQLLLIMKMLRPADVGAHCVRLPTLRLRICRNTGKIRPVTARRTQFAPTMQRGIFGKKSLAFSVGYAMMIKIGGYV